MYDDAPNFLRSSEGHVVPCYPTESITIPVALFYVFYPFYVSIILIISY